MSLSDILPYTQIIAVMIAFVGIILTVIGIVLSQHNRRSDKVQRIIIDLIITFINPNIDKLKIDSNLREFEFPRSLNVYFGIVDKNDAFRRFSERKFLWIIKWRINTYRKFSDEINNKIIELAQKAQGQKLIEGIHDVYGHSRVLQAKYMQMSEEDLSKLLHKHDLTDDIKEIDNMKKELAPKADELWKKLEKLKNKWIRKYYLVPSDF